MPAPNPQTIFDELNDEITSTLLDSGHFADATGEVWTRLFDRAEKLARASTIDASVVKSSLYALAGDLGNAEYWARNISLNKAEVKASQAYAIVYTNLGYASRASQYFPKLCDVRDGLINTMVNLGLSCASYADMVRAAEALERAGGTLTQTESVGIARSAVEALGALHVDESQVQAMMDRAGEIMRARGLLWLNRAPDIHSSAAGEGRYLAVNYRVDVTPTEAAHMNWQLAEALAQADLMPYGVTVGFVGCKATSVAA